VSKHSYIVTTRRTEIVTEGDVEHHARVISRRTVDTPGEARALVPGLNPIDDPQGTHRLPDGTVIEVRRRSGGA
jgi:hypothetical protein